MPLLLYQYEKLFLLPDSLVTPPHHPFCLSFCQVWHGLFLIKNFPQGDLPPPDVSVAGPRLPPVQYTSLDVERAGKVNCRNIVIKW